jgi:hypothetical protein
MGFEINGKSQTGDLGQYQFFRAAGTAKFIHTQPTGKLRFRPLNQHNSCYFVKGNLKVKVKVTP